MAAIQAGADLKFTNNRKQNALAVAEACGFDLGVELLRKANLLVDADGQPHRLLQPANIIYHRWSPGLRYHFKRLILLDTAPPPLS